MGASSGGFTAFLRGEAGNLVDGRLPFRGSAAATAAELVAVDVLHFITMN
jgi:hypothetical protein